jgi:hypothetical protein
LNVLTGHRPRPAVASTNPEHQRGARHRYRRLSGAWRHASAGDWASSNPTFTIFRGSRGTPHQASDVPSTSTPAWPGRCRETSEQVAAYRGLRPLETRRQPRPVIYAAVRAQRQPKRGA